ncbi:mechanosensitive ion channel [Puniceicoccales bacterium CK1056]|uniref:Mechanosensitive ion channel n=1 Tax=Oceanipulchritudo coccoides TaxID=2706888 RepID=A0A6B2M6U9_9BACT|nr:mechanosensitive ion channel domain-containing protein [Oceanipulchritudo coccoides]NDV63535.1 mechanosensitive ion channel [Oceanipulchritudo coccoides]
MELSPEQIDALIAAVTYYGLKIVVALLVFVIGKWIAGLCRKLSRRAMEKSNVDQVLVGFLSNIVFYLLMVAVIIAAVSQLGIQTTSFVAVLGAAGLAVGFALQGSLSNFASGVLIILFRPFKIGDFVEAGGVTGVIDEIGILVTLMHTPDNKKIIVPNSQVMSGHIVNFNALETRRCDMVFGIGYGDDIDKAKGILMDIIGSDERVLKDPAPTVTLSELADSSVNFNVRPWVNASDFWGVYFDTQEAVKKRFDAEGVSIPFPQRDVHLFQEQA